MIIKIVFKPCICRTKRHKGDTGRLICGQVTVQSEGIFGSMLLNWTGYVYIKLYYILITKKKKKTRRLWGTWHRLCQKYHLQFSAEFLYIKIKNLLWNLDYHALSSNKIFVLIHKKKKNIEFSLLRYFIQVCKNMKWQEMICDLHRRSQI